MNERMEIPVWVGEPPVKDTGGAPLYAMYSSVWGGIVTDSRWMLVPAGDHLVHRGDGVFETVKCVQGHLYQFAPHLARLRHSAEAIGLTPLPSDHDLTRIVSAVVRAGGHPDCLLRILLSRGPGGMGIDPRECPEPGLYVIAYRLPPPFMESHPGGAHACRSAVPIKPGILASIKSCNYLPNVLLKFDAIRAGADFAFGFDDANCLAEGATENFGMVTPDRRLLIPPPGAILDGTSMLRAFELADALIADGALAGKDRTPIDADRLDTAAEVLIFGTTTDVTAVTRLDGRPVGDGRPGPVFRELSRLYCAEQYAPPTPQHTAV